MKRLKYALMVIVLVAGCHTTPHEDAWPAPLPWIVETNNLNTGIGHVE